MLSFMQEASYLHLILAMLQVCAFNLNFYVNLQPQKPTWRQFSSTLQFTTDSICGRLQIGVNLMFDFCRVTFTDKLSIMSWSLSLGFPRKLSFSSGHYPLSETCRVFTLTWSVPGCPSGWWCCCSLLLHWWWWFCLTAGDLACLKLMTLVFNPVTGFDVTSIQGPVHWRLKGEQKLFKKYNWINIFFQMFVIYFIDLIFATDD